MHIFQFLLSFIFSILICCYTAHAQAELISYKLLRGSEIIPYVHSLSFVCNTVYSEYPYLYDGTADEYTYYLENYANSTRAAVCFAFCGEQVIGLATGIPMTENRTHYRKPFEEKNYDLSTLFYLGELVLLPEYRGQGIGKTMYLAIEQFARQEKAYTTLCFAQIDESTLYQEKPLDYQPINPFWIKLGFQRHLELHMIGTWKNIGETHETQHEMLYWIKEL